MHFDETAPVRDQREKTLLAAAGDKAVHIIGIPGRQRDPRGDAAVAEEFAGSDLHDSSGRQIEHQVGTRQAYPAEIVTPPNALPRITFRRQVAQEKAGPRIIARITEHFGQFAGGDQLRFDLQAFDRSDLRCGEFPDRAFDENGLSPRRIVVGGLLPILLQGAGIEPLDPPQLRVDPAHLRAITGKSLAAPVDQQFLASDRSLQVEERLYRVQNAGNDPFVLQLHGDRVFSFFQIDATKLVLRISRRITVGPFGKILPVDPDHIPRSPAQPQVDAGVRVKRKRSAETDMDIGRGRCRVGPHQPFSDLRPRSSSRKR